MRVVTQYVEKAQDLTCLRGIRLLRRMAPKQFASPPVLLLSYPRSGSSWAGKILATSKQLAYLREPITQPYLKRLGGEQAVFNVEDSHSDFDKYKKLADEAFAGIPRVHRGVIDNKRDFLPFTKNTNQKLLIKEVNPGAAKFYCTQYNVFLCLLLRHPAAVALSFHERGWLQRHSELLTDEPELDEWGRFGKLYGTFVAEAVEVVAQHHHAKIIQYEALVSDPKQQYANLFTACGVAVPDNFDSVIEQYCYSQSDLSSGYQTQRNSQLTAQKWKTKLSAEQINSLREGYLKSALAYYREPSDWPI